MSESRNNCFGNNPYDNASYTITAEQQKEAERKLDLEWMLHYLKKAILNVGDVKIGEAIAKIENGDKTKLHTDLINSNGLYPREIGKNLFVVDELGLICNGEFVNDINKAIIDEVGARYASKEE